MRFVTEQADLEIEAVVSAVSKNRESWKNWRCMKIETLARSKVSNSQNLTTGIKRILEIYLQGKQGTAYITNTGIIDIFCKDVADTLLETMGSQIVDLVRSTAGIAAMYRIFNLENDFDDFMAASGAVHPHEERQEDTAISSQQNLQLCLPNIENSKSDNLSNLNSIKVLLVEDDPVTRWMVKMALRDECRLMVAPDAGKALAAYKSNRPDLVLLDINLPGHNGHEIMAHIINSDPGAQIVMFSSHDSLENIVGSMASGAKDFIAKPFDRERLIDCVRKNQPVQ